MVRYLKDLFVWVVERMGFVHRHRWYLNGDASRLIIRDQTIDKKRRLGYAGAVFNTRSGIVTVGVNVIMGHNCMVLAGRHNDLISDPLLFKPNIDAGYDIELGDGVWLTSGVVVTGGVTIGDNTTVLPNSLVSTSLPSHCVAGGVPAQVLYFKEYE